MTSNLYQSVGFVKLIHVFFFSLLIKVKKISVLTAPAAIGKDRNLRRTGNEFLLHIPLQIWVSKKFNPQKMGMRKTLFYFFSHRFHLFAGQYFIQQISLGN